MIESTAAIPSDEVEETSNAFIQQVSTDHGLDQTIQTTNLSSEVVGATGVAQQNGAEPADLPTEPELASVTTDEADAGMAWALVPGLSVQRAVVPRPVPEQCDLSDPSLYFNQELSWLDFNWRVLWLALDERTPLLERVRFAANTASTMVIT